MDSMMEKSFEFLDGSPKLWINNILGFPKIKVPQIIPKYPNIRSVNKQLDQWDLWWLGDPQFKKSPYFLHYITLQLGDTNPPQSNPKITKFGSAKPFVITWFVIICVYLYYYVYIHTYLRIIYIIYISIWYKYIYIHSLRV